MTTIEENLKASGIMRKGVVSYDGEVGIEIETETVRPYDAPLLKYWNVEADGSLRDFGREYVLKGPMKDEEVKQALEEIRACNTKFKFKKDSISTSVHVHVNFQRESWLTLANFLVTYLAVENILIKFSGPDRLSNLFCMPACDAQGVVEILETLLTGVSKLNYRSVLLDENRVKYGALNCAPLAKFGSVEIRSFRGETDVDLIYEWVKIILELKAFAKTRGLTPPKILQLFNDDSLNFLENVFPNGHIALSRGFTRQQIVDLIPLDKNLYYCAKLSTVTKDWDMFGVPKPKKITKVVYRQHLDAIGMKMFNNPYNELAFGERIVVEEVFYRNNPNIQRILAADLREDV